MAQHTLDDLKTLMARLRDPKDGCPWDLKQSFGSITKHTLEEVFEVIDAIENNDLTQLRDELGDLLFQIVFYTQLGAEQGEFDFSDVVDSITAKLLRRHPHVFPDGTLNSRRQEAELSDEAIKAQWEQIKAMERVKKGNCEVFDDIPTALPALMRAEKLQKRVSFLGMDYADARAVLAAIKGEIEELETAIDSADPSAVADELGDVLFSAVNLSRHLKLDPENCLRAANAKFARRIQAMDELIRAADKQWSGMDAADFDSIWLQAKKISQKV